MSEIPAPHSWFVSVVLRGVARAFVGLAAVPWALLATFFFARRVGPFRIYETCATSGTWGIVWAVTEGLVALVGIVSALGFALDAWKADEPDWRTPANRSLARAAIAMAIWGPLMLVMPATHGCG